MSTLGDTSFWILTSLAGGRKHGYAILRDVAQAAGVAPKATTLYASLERLEQQGLIRADGDEIVDGRARRYFVVTDTGRDGLDARAAEFEERARAARAALMRGARTRAVPPRGAPARPIRTARVWA
ncbi:PadR family transcriptional regulator [Microbacterium sp. CH-015]|uniref:PadR family transcriptional regulator n=1 Tax=Microbacterium sp. CH-015 TaxID=3406734 RepID=UPI003C73520E